MIIRTEGNFIDACRKNALLCSTWRSKVRVRYRAVVELVGMKEDAF